MREDRWFGQGTWYSENGDIYTGKWYDWRYGQGEIRYSNGTRYTGQWNENERNGQGILYNAEDQILDFGYWENDLCIDLE